MPPAPPRCIDNDLRSPCHPSDGLRMGQNIRTSWVMCLQLPQITWPWTTRSNGCLCPNIISAVLLISSWTLYMYPFNLVANSMGMCSVKSSCIKIIIMYNFPERWIYKYTCNKVSFLMLWLFWSDWHDVSLMLECVRFNIIFLCCDALLDGKINGTTAPPHGLLWPHVLTNTISPSPVDANFHLSVLVIQRNGGHLRLTPPPISLFFIDSCFSSQNKGASQCECGFSTGWLQHTQEVWCMPM